jgi:hypothetical protein
MNLVERAKNILFKPKDEWNVISQETTSVTQLVTGYLLILALIPAVGQFVRYGLIGYTIPFVGHVPGSMSYGIRQAVVSYIASVGGVFLSAYIIDALAPSFASQKNFQKAMQLVVYSYTAMFVAGIFNIIPGLAILSIVGLYGLYILYIGIKPLMQTPEDKVTTYFIVSLLVIIAVYAVLSLVLAAILVKSAYTAAAVGYPGL